MNLLSRVFLKGLAVVVPIAGTIGIVVWLGLAIEGLVRTVLNPIFPRGWDFPGLGILLGIATVLGVGLLVHFWVFKKLFEFLGRILGRAPLVKAIYGSLKDLSDFIFPSSSAKKKWGSSVLIRMKNLGITTVGFEMVGNLSDHELGKGFDDASGKVIVYLPMSYQIGGYMAIVDKEDITPLDISTEEMLRLTLTAGVTGSDKEDKAGDTLK